MWINNLYKKIRYQILPLCPYLLPCIAILLLSTRCPLTSSRVPVTSSHIQPLPPLSLQSQSPDLPHPPAPILRPADLTSPIFHLFPARMLSYQCCFACFLTFQPSEPGSFTLISVTCCLIQGLFAKPPGIGLPFQPLSALSWLCKYASILSRNNWNCQVAQLSPSGS